MSAEAIMKAMSEGKKRKANRSAVETRKADRNRLCADVIMIIRRILLPKLATSLIDEGSKSLENLNIIVISRLWYFTMFALSHRTLVAGKIESKILLELRVRPSR